MAKGWKYESRRHSLASKGIKTAQKIPNICGYEKISKQNKPQQLTPEMVTEAYHEGQKSADDKFKEMLGIGDQYVVTNEQTGQKYGLLGACGFAWIHFKGVKNKNMLEKAGIKVSKAYSGGYTIWAIPLSAPQWAIEKHPEARAYYSQSMDLKMSAMNGFLKSMQDKGYLKDAYVDSRMD